MKTPMSKRRACAAIRLCFASGKEWTAVVHKWESFTDEEAEAVSQKYVNEIELRLPSVWMDECVGDKKTGVRVNAAFVVAAYTFVLPAEFPRYNRHLVLI